MIYALILVYMMMALTFSGRPLKSSMSRFELERRAKLGHKSAQEILSREQLLPDVMVWKNMKLAMATMLFIALAYIAYGFVLAILISGLAWLSLGPVSRLSFVNQLANKLYQKTEPMILKYVAKISPVLKFFQAVSQEFVPKVSSKEELISVVANLEPGVLQANEQSALLELMDSDDKLIKDVMVATKSIKSVKADELLGPLVLDKLHSTGFSRFPVITKSINHVVGVLDIKSLLELGSKKSVKAEKAMSPSIHFIREDRSLVQAFAVALGHRADFLVVIDNNRKTVGLVTLKDIAAGILGREAVKVEDIDCGAIEDISKKTYNSSPNGIDL